MKQALLLIVTALSCTASASAHSQGQGDLHAFLQSQFRGERTDPDARYALALADLDGDRRPEAIVYLQSRNWCGTGGCTLFIYRAAGRSWREVAHLPATHLPLRLLGTRSHGWRDLAVGGRELRGNRFIRYERRFRFDARTYPVGRDTRLTTPAPGRVLIAKNDRGRPLF